MTTASLPLSGVVECDGAEATPVTALAAQDRAEMLELLTTHFDGVTTGQFERDLQEKDWVLRIRRGGRLLGFSTMAVYSTTHAGRRINVIYSGDTIVAPEGWGSPALARGWIATVKRLQAMRATEPWYWLLLSSGFRTYRFLPVFWREFSPRFDEVPHTGNERLLATLACERFGECFDEAAGVVRFARPQRLRAELAAVPDGRDRDPHVQFFLRRNPGHANGDELVCLAALNDDNLTPAGRRMTRGLSP